MHPPGGRVHLRDQGIAIGPHEFLELPPFEDHPRQLVPLGGQFLEHVGARRPGAGARLPAAPVEAELVEQHLPELLGRAQVERPPGELPGPFLELRHARTEALRELPQPVGVDADAEPFHPGHHRHQRPVEPLVDPGDALLEEKRPQNLPQPQGHLRILGAVGDRPIHRHAVEGDLRRPLAAERGVGQGLVAEMAVGQLVEPVAVAGAVDHVGDEERVVVRRHREPVALENRHVELQIVTDLEDPGIGQYRGQPLRHLGEGELALDPLSEIIDMLERQVETLAGLDGEADAHDASPVDGQGIGLEIDGEPPRLARPREHRLEGRHLP